MKVHFGRHVYGLSAVAFGVITLVWHDPKDWAQFSWLGNVPHGEILLYIAAAIELSGGVAVQWLRTGPRTARAGAVALGATYLLFALRWVPAIAAKPLVYDGWGSFFEQFSLFSGALIIFASVHRSDSQPAPHAARIGYILFGICVISFAMYQLLYLPQTASLVPKWIPPGPMFWAITTTIAFALAAIALLSGRSALLASRLLTAMLMSFGLLVWLPRLFADPHSLTNWSEGAETLAISGVAWIVADFLSQNRSGAMEL
jgi:hypothetical protein